MSFFNDLCKYEYVNHNNGGSMIRNKENGQFVNLEAEFGSRSKVAVSYLRDMYEAEINNEDKEDSVDDNQLDMYNDNIQVLEGMDEDHDKDVMGDLPNWDELESWEAYASEFFWFKYQYEEDGSRKPVYVNPKKNYHYQDGSSWGRNNVSGDPISANIDLMAWAEGVMLKLVDKHKLELAKKQVTTLYESDVSATLEEGAGALYDTCMREYREQWIKTTKLKNEEIRALQPDINKFLCAKEGRITPKELAGRIIEYAHKVNAKAEEKELKGNDLFEFRKEQCQKLFQAVLPSLKLKDGYMAPKIMMVYVGKLFWAAATDRLVRKGQNMEELAEEKVNNPLVLQWGKTYCRYILSNVWMERKAQDNHVDNLNFNRS